ncbi:hypothetical protein [Kerstersia sp.]|uniref:hypothetical protein n=1 Tax=Kerstersia sp. TaxID=1930783 RepID=UPI003F903CA8
MIDMKKISVAIALLAAMGAANAYDSVGGVTDNDTFLRVGPATSTGFHGPEGAPGIGLGGQENWIISLQSISLPYPGISAGQVNGFARYQLVDYAHAPVDPNNPDPQTENYNFNWLQVPTANASAATALKVFFGAVTQKSNNHTQAFYVGDRNGFAMPTGATTYDAAGLLVPSGTDGSSPITLSGTLNLDAAVKVLTGSLADTSANHTLAINAGGATNVQSGPGTFNGDATYNGVDYTNSVDGHFYGSGNDSSLAGTVNGGNDFQAAIGGIKK